MRPSRRGREALCAARFFCFCWCGGLRCLIGRFVEYSLTELDYERAASAAFEGVAKLQVLSTYNPKGRCRLR